MLDIAESTSPSSTGRHYENASLRAVRWISASCTTNIPVTSQIRQKTEASRSIASSWIQYLATSQYAASAPLWQFLQLSSPPASSQPDTDVVESKLSTSILIAAHEMPDNLPFAEALRTRLMTLVLSCLDNSEQDPLSPASLSDFFDFLKKTPGLIYPSVVITPEGNIRARWQESPSRYVALEFFGDMTLEFVVFAPERSHPGKISRVSGTSSLDSVMEKLAPYRTIEWMAEPAYA